MRISVTIITASVAAVIFGLTSPAIAQRAGDLSAPLARADLQLDEDKLPRFYGYGFDLPRMDEAEREALLTKLINGNSGIVSAVALPEHNKVLATRAAALHVNQITDDGKASVITLDASGQPTNDPVTVIEGTGMGARVTAQNIAQLSASGGTVRISYVLDRSGSMDGQALEDVKEAFVHSLSTLPQSANITCKLTWFNEKTHVMNAAHNNGWVGCDAGNFDLSDIDAEGGTRPLPVLTSTLSELENSSATGTHLSGLILMTDGQNFSAKDAQKIGGHSSPIMTFFAGEADTSVYPDISKLYLDHGDTASAQTAFEAFMRRFVFARVVDLNTNSGSTSE